MGTVDDGWMDAADFGEELPFGNFDDGSGTKQAYTGDDIVGSCPVCEPCR